MAMIVGQNPLHFVTALLADAGYDCGLSGKLHLAGAQGRIEPRPKHDGYRVFHWSHGPHDIWETGHDYADWLREKGYILAEMLKHPEDIRCLNYIRQLGVRIRQSNL